MFLLLVILISISFVIFVQKEFWFQTLNFKSVELGPHTCLAFKVGLVQVNTFLPVKNKFVYSYHIKVHTLGLEMFWKAFSASYICRSVSPVAKLLGREL